MKRIAIFSALTLTLTLCCSLSFAQKISDAETRVLFDKAFTALKNSDVRGFSDLWVFDSTIVLGSNDVFTKDDVLKIYKEAHLFLDSALTNNMRIDEIEITESSKAFGAKYKIKAYFKYNEKTNYIKAIGFRVDYIDNKWVFRFNPEYTTGFRTKD